MVRRDGGKKKGEKELAVAPQLRHANIALTMPRWIGGRAMASGSRTYGDGPKGLVLGCVSTVLVHATFDHV